MSILWRLLCSGTVRAKANHKANDLRPLREEANGRPQARAIKIAPTIKMPRIPEVYPVSRNSRPCSSLH